MSHGPAEARLILHRQLAGYGSWRALCAAHHLPRACLVRFLRGGVVRDKFVARLARALKIPPSQLRAHVRAYVEERAASEVQP
jgi:hypothetical protein